MSANHLCLFIPILLSISSNGNEHLPGHLQPLGLQTPPVGGVLTVNNIPSPEEFFYQFVKPGKPVLFKGAASKTPAYQQWTDNYLRCCYYPLYILLYPTYTYFLKQIGYFQK